MNFIEIAYILASVLVQEPRAELECFAHTIYFEARGEPLIGQLAVGEVIVNRKELPQYPDTICGVVEEQRAPGRYHCQFTWWCDGKSDTPVDIDAHLVAIAVTVGVLLGHDTSGTTTHYHTLDVSPSWANWEKLSIHAQLGNHIFYSER